MSAGNVHTPERLPGETKAQHRERLATSRAIVAAMQPVSDGESSRKKLRALQRKNGDFKAGAFGKGLIAAQTARQLAAIQAKRKGRRP